MCSIAGIVSFNKGIDLRELDQMNLALKHRGPDHRAIYSTDKIGLAYNRLSIIDHSEKAHQPFKKHNCILIFNGLVYNYIELRNELKAQGYEFESDSDTEVVISAYHHWGKHCFQKFNGMWALAIYDLNKAELILSRDRFGIKPLYLFHSKQFYFASEIKAFKSIPTWEEKLNHEVAFKFLHDGKKNTDQSSFFNNVKSLQAGSIRVYDLKHSRYYDESFYSFEGIERKSKLSFDDAADEFKALFKSSCQLRMRADVPIAYSLSGGLDSSSIVAVSASAGLPIKALNAKFDNDKYNELSYINALSEKWSINTVYVQSDFDSLISALDNCILSQDEPFGSMSILAQYKVFQKAKSMNIKVMCGGQGADEYLIGYDHALKHFLLQNWWKSPISSMMQLMRLGNREKLNMRINAGQKVLNNLPKRFQEGKGKVELEQLSKAYITSDVLPSLLHYEDRNSMANSIESRLPFMDHRLIEFCLSLPINHLIDSKERKKILRKAMSGLLPESILNRKDKMAFVTPQDQWFKLHNNRFKELFEADKELSHDLLGEIKWSDIKKSHSLAWRLICFNRWLRLFDLKL